MIQLPTLTPASSRSLPLDVIRGVAVLGMIFINILVFIPDVNELIFRDTLAGHPTTEGTIYKLIYVLFNGKMRALFALLFGAGIILFFRPGKPHQSDHFARRMLWLLVFGLLHAYLLLWHGTILFEYAACGMLLFTFRELQPRTLILGSLLVLGFYTWLNAKDFSRSYENYTGYVTALQMETKGEPVPENLLKQKEKFTHTLDNYPPFSETRQQELETQKQENIIRYTADAATLYKQNTETANEALSFGVYLNILESIATMLLGMGLFRSGFFEFNSRKYLHTGLIAVGIPLGIFLYLHYYSWQSASQKEVLQLYAWKNFSPLPVEASARMILSLGYCSLLIWLCSLSLLKPALTLLANVGRMAFSNYVGQTMICVIFFYGFKQYGKLGVETIAGIAVCIGLFQVLVSSIWIKYFKMGPLEYVWRRVARWELPSEKTI